MNTAFSVDGIFGDHMVLQRDRPIRISGTAPRGMVVNVDLGEGVRGGVCTAGADGDWAVELEPLGAGGPFNLRVSTVAFSRSFKDILVGDVWFCSGQSNMEYPLCGDYEWYHLPEGEQVAAAANDDRLRVLFVPHAVSPECVCRNNTYSPQWFPATSRDVVAYFSAVGYLFGKELRRRLDGDVPIGLIDSSWGGTRIEPWISRVGFEAAGLGKSLSWLDASIAKLDRDEASPSSKRDEECGYGGAFREWILEKFRKYAPEATARAMASWHLPGDTSPEWRDATFSQLPGRIAEVGTHWMRCTFRFPAGHKGERAFFHAEHVDDSDIVFLDGRKIGENSPFVVNFWALPRNYVLTVPDDGEALHTITIRLENHFCSGTFTGKVAIMNDAGDLVPLADAPWQTRTEYLVDSEKIGIRPMPDGDWKTTFFGCQTPTTLYNSMVAPSARMNIKGAIWYQGCSNAGEWKQYGALQAALVEDWRRAWRDPKMPVLITQLAGFWGHRPDNRGEEGFWKSQKPSDTIGYAPMREVQQAFLDYPGSGVACTIDIGDAYDIHPQRKGPVAERLAHEAMRVAYGDETALPGPRAVGATREDGAVRVEVANAGRGLVGEVGPHVAALAFADGSAEWADASVGGDGKSLVVKSPRAAEAVEVQYAYSAFAPGPFVRRDGDGLPLFPFKLKI